MRSNYTADVQIIDRAGPYLELLARTLPAEYNRALRHIGWWLHGEIKAGMRQAAPGGQQWAEMSPVTRGLRRLRKERQYNKPGGRLAQLVRYRHDAQDMAVHIGWIDESVAKLAHSFQRGSERPATHRQRRFFNVLTYRARRLRLGESIKIPARPTIAPVYAANQSEIPARIHRRIQGYLSTANHRAGMRILRSAAKAVA